VVSQLNTLFREAAASAAVSSWMKSVTLELAPSTPAEFARLVKSDADMYGSLIKRVGLVLD
jgi:tripartite-type tricarboxylate transporter receptor subunit TctC